MKKIERPDERADGRKCFVCGPDNPQGLHLEFYKLDEETITAQVTPPPEWCGWDNLMHGGFHCVFLDEITAWAVTGLRGVKHFVTAGLDVRYRKPVRLNQTLVLKSSIIEESSRGAKVRGQICNQAGEVLSEAKVRIVYLDEERFHQIVDNAP